MAISTLKTYFAAAAALGAMMGSLAADDATYELKYKFQPGEFLYYEVSNAMKIVTQYNGAAEESQNTSQAWKQLRVVSVDEAGNALLEPMVERVRMSAIRDEEEAAKYDSAEDGEAPPQFLQLQETIGKVMARVNVSAHGELNQVLPTPHASAALVDAAKKKDPRLNFLIVLPQMPVRINDSWKDRFETDVTVEKGLTQKVVVQRAYTLAAVNGSIATIKLKTSVVTPIDDPQLKVQLIQRTPSGIIEFDLDKGRIVLMKTGVDEVVVNAFGPKSSMSAVTSSTEKLLPSRPELKVVNRPAK
jgi:hypothetical protein